MDAKAAWEYLGISERMLNKYAADGRLTFVKTAKLGGGFTREFDEDELREFKASMGARPGRVAGGNGGLTLHPALGNVQSAERQAELLTGLVGATIAQTLGALESRGLLASATQAPHALAGSAMPTLTVALTDKLLLTLTEAAALTGLSRKHLAAAMRSGELGGKKIGRGWKVRPDRLRSYVDAVA